jgi:ubiquitin
MYQLKWLGGVGLVLFVFAGGSSKPTPKPEPVTVQLKQSDSCVARLARQFDRGDQKAAHSRAIDSGFKFEDYRELWIAMQASIECPK